jgi:hypothetical protein
MKPTEFKKLIKEAVREAIQDELKDILLEAVKSSKQPAYTAPAYVTENIIHSNPTIGTGMTQVNSAPSSMSPEQRRAMYENMLGETAMSFNSNTVQTFRPNPGGDTINGSLAEGDVSMDQIMNLMSNK